MRPTKESVYYETLMGAVSALGSETGPREALDTIVHSIAEAMGAGVSVVMLDSSGKKLIHSASWGVPDLYLHKGVLDAAKSLGEVAQGQSVVIDDVQKDSRVQYPDLAAKAGIAAMLGVPLIIGGAPAGALRVYSRTHNAFSNEDVTFVSAMAKLVSSIIVNQRLWAAAGTVPQPDKRDARQTTLKRFRKAAFAHPSEKEFARLLDFYGIEWVYEPRSFPLDRGKDAATEMFTPDFYLPGLDLYLELTTLKQSLVTKKNRKLRRLRELYPEIKISLLYKKDFERLLAKYGVGPLSESRSRRVDHVLYSSAEIQRRVKELARQVSKDYADRHPVMIGVLRGVFCFMADIVREMTVPLDIDFMAISYFHDTDGSTVKITRDIDISVTGRHVIMVEDIVDTGMTLSYILKHVKLREPASLAVCTLLDKRVRRIADVVLDYIGFEIPDEFVVGYGLDYQEEYRNLPFIGVLGSDLETKKPSK